MAQSFSTQDADGLADKSAKRRTILVTGATGNIGAYFAEQAHERYNLKLMIRKENEESEALKPYGELVRGTLDNLEGLKKLCEGVDTVLHLAAAAGPSSVWDDLLQANIIGTYNVMVAAKSAGCRRVIYASSIHAISGYPADVQVKTTDPVNPGDLYGVSKCFGEALGRYMAEQEGLSVVAIRIGGFQPREFAEDPESIIFLDAWVSQRDLQQLLEKSIDADNLQFGILHGLSDNRFKRMDISDTRELVGYQPQDDLTELNPKLKPLDLDHSVLAHNLGDPKQESGLREEI